MENRTKIYMVCGISGSGKSCFAKKLALKGIPRLSIDEELWPDYYVLADILSDEHKEALYCEAVKRIRARVANFCTEKHPCSVDMPFCQRAQREEFRSYIESCGGESVLLWIKTDLPVLKRRLAERAGKNGPDNLPVSEEEIEMYWRGFERPTEENAVIINGEADFDIEKILKTI
ncbi:MAG: ATP-binding protein [Oscillospiraceae bacterium]|nr:ATP-binding protein [Oscillospiraceae bacterium]